MSGTKMRDPMNVMSLVTVAFLVFGTVLAVVRGDVYWTFLAAWALALITLPYLRYTDLERSQINWLMFFITLPYLASFLLGSDGSGLLPVDSLWYLVLSSISIFALCMVTIACISSCGGMDLNLKFGMQVAFMLYASLVVIQGPVFFYSDLWFGTSLLSSNDEFMGYIVLATINGLLLTVGFYAIARARLLRETITAGEVGQ